MRGAAAEDQRGLVVAQERRKLRWVRVLASRPRLEASTLPVYDNSPPVRNSATTREGDVQGDVEGSRSRVPGGHDRASTDAAHKIRLPKVVNPKTATGGPVNGRPKGRPEGSP